MGLLRWRRRRRSGIAGWTMPDDWQVILDARFAQWRELDAAERARLHDLVVRFMRETRWEAARGGSLDDEMRLLIAAQACLLLLGLDRDGFTGITSVIVHQRPVVLRGDRAHDVPGVRVSGPQTLLGQANYRGPVLLSWPSVASGARFPQRGHNVVFHEFAHQLDMLDGTVDGTPPLDDPEALARWIAVCTAAYSAVRGGQRLAGAQGLRRREPGRVLRRGHGGVLLPTARAARARAGAVRRDGRLLRPGSGGARRTCGLRDAGRARRLRRCDRPSTARRGRRVRCPHSW